MFYVRFERSQNMKFSKQRKCLLSSLIFLWKIQNKVWTSRCPDSQFYDSGDLIIYDDDDDDDDDDVEAPTLTGYTLHLLLWSSKSVESIL